MAKVYFRSGDVLVWLFILICLLSSWFYIYMPDGNEYVKWFDTLMRSLFPTSLVLFPFVSVYMYMHRIVKHDKKQSIIKVEYESR